MGKYKKNAVLAGAVVGVVGFSHTVRADSFTWGGGFTNGAFGSAANWVGNVAPGTADIAVFSTRASAPPQVPNWAATDSVLGFSIDNSGGYVWQFPRGGSGNRQIIVGSSGITLSGGGATGWGAIPTFVNVDQTWTIGTNTTLDFVAGGTSSGTISGGGKISLNGNGTVNLAGNGTTFTGGWNVTAGVLRNAGASTAGVGVGTIFVSGTGVYQPELVGAGNMTGGTVDLGNGGSLRGSYTTGAFAHSGVVIDGAAAVNFTTKTSSDAFPITPVITGGDATSVITASGPGTISLSNGSEASTSYAGKWKVSGGTLRVVASDALGNRNGTTINTSAPNISNPTSVELAGGTLSLSGTNSSSGVYVNFNNPVNVTADSTILIDRQTTASTVGTSFSVAARQLGGLSIGSNTLNIGKTAFVTGVATAGAPANIGVSTLSLSDTPTINVVAGTTSFGVAFTANFLTQANSSNGIIKTGDGILAVRNANASFSGPLTVKAGTAQALALNAWGTSTITTLPSSIMLYSNGLGTWTASNNWAGNGLFQTEGGTTVTMTFAGGSIAPGSVSSAAGILSYAGRLNLAKSASNASGNLNIDLQGIGGVAGTDYDQLLLTAAGQNAQVLSGLSNYNLNLNVTGVTPTNAATYDIISLASGTIGTGNFANVATANTANPANAGGSRIGATGTNGLASFLEVVDSANRRVRLSGYLSDNQYSGASGGNWTAANAANWTVLDPNGSVYAAEFADSASFSGAGTVNVDANRTVLGLILNSTARQYTLAQTNSAVLTLDNTANGGAATVSAVGQQIVNVPLALASNLAVVTPGSTDSLTIGGSITGTNKTLTKTGTGSLILTGSSGYGGLTTVSAGTLQIGAGTTSGQLSTGPITNNATLAVKRSDTYTLNNTIGGSGAFVQAGVGTTVLSATSTYSGATSVVAGALDVTGALTNSASITVDASANAAHLILDHAGALASTAAVAGLGTTTFPLIDVNTAQSFASLNSTGTTNFTAGSSTVGPIDGTGTLGVTGSANLTATYVRHGGLSVGSGSTVTLAHDNQSATGGTPIGTSAVTTLSVDAAGTLDLTNNGIIVTDTTQFGAIQSSLATAYAAGWASPGITSSTAAAHTGDHGVGYALASAIGSTSFNGITFADAVIARYTLLGDTNLKGGVDLGDYTKVITNLGKTGTVWSDGNFDYSGTVGLGDYTKVILALGRTDATALNDTALNGTAGPSAKQVRASSSALTLKAAAATVSPAAAPAATATDVHLVVNTASGLVTLISAVSGSQAIITAYTVKSPSGSLVKFKNSGSKYLGSAFQNNPGVFYSSSNGNTYNNWTGIKNTSTIIGEGFGNNYIATNDTTWTNYTLSSGGYALGAMFKTLSAGGVQDLSFQWDDKALNTFTSVVDYVGGTVPEPTSVSLIAMGAVGLLGRRRRRSLSK